MSHKRASGRFASRDAEFCKRTHHAKGVNSDITAWQLLTFRHSCQKPKGVVHLHESRTEFQDGFYVFGHLGKSAWLDLARKCILPPGGICTWDYGKAFPATLQNSSVNRDFLARRGQWPNAKIGWWLAHPPIVQTGRLGSHTKNLGVQCIGSTDWWWNCGSCRNTLYVFCGGPYLFPVAAFSSFEL